MDEGAYRRRVEQHRENGDTSGRRIKGTGERKSIPTGARAIRDVNNDNWRSGNGRKEQRRVVVWRLSCIPMAGKSTVKVVPGLSRHTILKHWEIRRCC